MIQPSATHFISFEDAAQIAPALLTNEPCPSRSSRYSFVSSREIYESMEQNDWGLSKVSQSGSRKSNPKYRKHMMVFRSRNSEPFEDPRHQDKLLMYSGNTLTSPLIFPELRVINSMDGTSSLRISMGLHALICSNGLVANIGEGFEFATRHQNFDPTVAFESIKKFSGHLPKVFGKIQEFGGIELEHDIRVRFARDAAKLRFPNGAENPEMLLQPRREIDRAKDLWTTYNVVQENCMRGGQRLNKRVSRPLLELTKQQNFNEELWSLAEEYAEVLS